MKKYPLRVLFCTDAIHLAILKELARLEGISISQLIRKMADEKFSQLKKEGDKNNAN